MTVRRRGGNNPLLAAEPRPDERDDALAGCAKPQGSFFGGLLGLLGGRPRVMVLEDPSRPTGPDQGGR